MILGVVGLFIGSNASFELPPVLGFLPFILGWAMCVTMIKFWKLQKQSDAPEMIHSKLFMDFLEVHPEFRQAPLKMQWSAFHQWLDMR